MDERFLKICGYPFHVDIDEIYNAVKLDESVESEAIEDGSGAPVDVTKYEFIKMMLETILVSEVEDIKDDSAYDELESLSIPFKIAFNTLLKYNILKEG